MSCYFLLQGIFLNQGSNSGLLHYRQMFYCLSQQGTYSCTLLSLKNLEYITSFLILKATKFKKINIAFKRRLIVMKFLLPQNFKTIYWEIFILCYDGIQLNFTECLLYDSPCQFSSWAQFSSVQSLSGI